MKLFLPLISILLVGAGCLNTIDAGRSGTVLFPENATLLARNANHAPKRPARDSQPTLPKPYSTITLAKTELLKAAPGTKSVLFNTSGSRLYAMNLEGMSVYEFDQPSRTIIREFKFKPTRGTGWDYVKEKPIPSYQEKPVEACFSHNDQILWVSLHNAEGIVPIRIDSLGKNLPFKQKADSIPLKKISVIYPGRSNKDSFNVPLIKTGKTPKIISRTVDNKYLLVSNWHSYNVSVLEMNKDAFPFAKVISTIPVSAIPRGIVVDDKTNRSFVAIMGGASLAVINNSVWMKESDMAVASNPRHIVMDTSGHLFVSYNRIAQIACIDGATGETLFTAPTHAQPRTIMLSKNHKFLFVTCYSSDFVDIFKINDSGFEKVTSLPCKGHPVGVDIFENDDTLEAWVCSYSNGSISVFSFKKN
jgi:DNA-binding beta-propeller fold protein YncE